MDTSRPILSHRLPRHRLDAGSFAAMGVGAGFAIASALYCRDYAPSKRVICIQGDASFGFAALELETAYRLSIFRLFILGYTCLYTFLWVINRLI